MTTSLQIKDGAGFSQNIAYETNGGVLSPHHVPEIGGAVVTPSNPMPVRAGTITLTQTVVSVTSSSTVLVAANANRKYLALMNSGASDVTIAVGGGSAVLGAGWVFAAAAIAGSAGGGLVWDAAAVPSQAFAGIVAGAASNVIVLEGV